MKKANKFGFRTFVAKIEGKEPAPLLKKVIPLPGSFTGSSLREFCEEVIDLGVDSYIEPDLVDSACAWHTTTIESELTSLYQQTNPICETILEACTSWLEQLNKRENTSGADFIDLVQVDCPW